MYMNAGYLTNSTGDFQDDSVPLIVGSCGTCHIYTHPRLLTWQPKGRVDYQLLYIASGKAHFTFTNKEEIVTAGHMVLYQPLEEQLYAYYGTDKTEVYWIHFTGSDVTDILSHYELPTTGHVFYTGTSLHYQDLFLQIIRELQLCQVGFKEMLIMYFRQLLLFIQRQLKADCTTNSYLLEEINLAQDYFTRHFNETIRIDDYAASRHMSACWFIRSFKQITGVTPLQYILSVRIANAQSLLEKTDYTLTKIASLVGYDNPLYFSRIFKRHIGVSPSDYRKSGHPVADRSCR